MDRDTQNNIHLQGTEVDELGKEEFADLVDKKAAKVAAKGGGKKKQGKSERNPWKADGFQAFSAQRKKELKSMGDNSKESDLAAKLANEWLDLPDKAREDFVKDDTEGSKKADKKTDKKKAKSSAAAKEPESSPKTLTGYQLFCKERREELKASGQSKGMKPTEVMKLLGAEWKTQNDQQKGQFKEKAQKI